MDNVATSTTAAKTDDMLHHVIVVTADVRFKIDEVLRSPWK
jgi:hypothetical protein